jgi:hypothetical protein
VKIKNKMGVKIFGLVVLSLLLAVYCAEKGTEPNTNVPPDTFIDGFKIELAPDSATYYNTTVFWRGSDPDGAIYWYDWRIISDTGDSLYLYEIEKNEEGDSIGVDTTNISTWQSTADLLVTLRSDFPAFDKAYIFEVKAQDNDRDDDPTPAIDTIAVSRYRGFNYAPDTRIVTGPHNGATTGRGIHFIIQGEDIDGAVDSMEYKLDTDTEWTCVATDITTSSLTINVRNIPVGARTISFRAIDNFRKTDPSPVSVSVVVDSTLEPELVLSIKNDQAFIVPYTEPELDLTVSFIATVDFYYSAIDSFIVITSEGDTINTTETEITFEGLISGSYWVDVTAYDIGGNSTPTGQVNFSIVELAAGDGVLCVNGVDWESYGSEAVNLWANGVPWGNREHFKCWDLFDTSPLGDGTDFGDSLLGTGAPPTWMLDTTFFDAVVWMWNLYSGDDAYWLDEDLQAAVMSYLEMGGNLLIAGRFGHYIFYDASEDFFNYCQITGYTDALSPASAVAVHDSMSDMSGAGLSYTEVVTTGHANALQLFETNDGQAGLGWVIVPNGTGGGGAVCYIGGRNYRWTNADLKANIDVILRYFFGIAN